MPRKEKKFHFIYKTTNTITGRYYYGMHSTSNLDDGYLGSGKRLRYSINKYGKDSHIRENLEFFDTREDLANREKEIVNLNEIAKDKCMNLHIGGEGGFTKEESSKGTSTMLSKVWSDPEFRKRTSKRSSDLFKRLHKEGKIKPLNWTGRQHSDKTTSKIGKSNSKYNGEKSYSYNKRWINKDNISIRIQQEQLQEYLNDGWIRGRKINRKGNDDITKICPNCGKDFIVCYSKRNTICCSRSCAISFRYKK